jgi:hypothetical protein
LVIGEVTTRRVVHSAAARAWTILETIMNFPALGSPPPCSAWSSDTCRAVRLPDVDPTTWSLSSPTDQSGDLND